MMLQKVNVRAIALLLILVFFQKLGVELWVHNWLHESKTSHSIASAEKGKPVVQHHQVICNCLEDAMMPLVATTIVQYDPVSTKLIDVFLANYSSFLSVDKEFSALRGPPTLS